jgi:hypothetical protein
VIKVDVVTPPEVLVVTLPCAGIGNRDQVAPPFVEYHQATVGVGLPVAVAVNDAVPPAMRFRLAGEEVMVAGVYTARAVELLVVTWVVLVVPERASVLVTTT